MISKKKSSTNNTARAESPKDNMKVKTDDGSGKSMLNKSELSLIFLGAGLVTLIVFFFIFKPTSSDVAETQDTVTTEQTLEERLASLEQKLEDKLKKEILIDDSPGRTG